jgi:hypothetical protein
MQSYLHLPQHIERLVPVSMWLRMHIYTPKVCLRMSGKRCIIYLFFSTTMRLWWQLPVRVISKDVRGLEPRGGG